MQPTNGDALNHPSPRTPHSPAELGDISSPDRLSRSINTVHDRRSSFQAEESSSSSPKQTTDDDVEQVSEDIDRFTNALLNAADENSAPPEVSDSFDTFSKIIESRIASGHNSHHKMTEEDSFFIEAVLRLSKLSNAFSELSSTPDTEESLYQTTVLLQKAMFFLEEELRALLEDDSCANRNNSLKNSPISSDPSPDADLDGNCASGGNSFPGYSSEMLTKMRRIASAMISGGYERECLQVYSIARRSLFYEQLKKLENDKLNMDEVWRMSWDSLEKEINRWITLVKTCSKTLFPAEKQLGEKVFADHSLTFTPIFSNLARSVVIQLLDFAGAVAMTKRSAEKLFKFLDMYETLLDIIPAITDDSKLSENAEHELRSEIMATSDRLGEAAMNIFQDLENSIKNDVAKTAVPGGAVHPLTRYVLNYLKYACEYKATLEKIFEKSPKKLELSNPDSYPTGRGDSDGMDSLEIRTAFSSQIVRVMDFLYANIEAKSMLYKDTSLRYIFLMNNGRYVLQKVKGSPEIYQLVGDTWCRKRSTVVRQFHKNYQRETWVRLLHCLNQEGLLVNGKVNKSLLKERFKSFNTMFEDIHKSQTNWVVSDEQLQSELRVSISAVVIPAYRSFLGRFRQYLDSSKQVEKYIKYQPEDLELQIEGLFDGVPASMARRKT